MTALRMILRIGIIAVAGLLAACTALDSGNDRRDGGGDVVDAPEDVDARTDSGDSDAGDADGGGPADASSGDAGDAGG